jgi:hypothetical protein
MRKTVKTAPSRPLADIELHPDAWKRFESFVKAKLPKRPPAKGMTSRPSRTSRKPAKKA